LTVAATAIACAAFCSPAVASKLRPTGAFTVPTPAPGHVEIALQRVTVGKQFAQGAVPKPTLATALPPGILAVADVGRARKHHHQLFLRVMLINTNKRAATAQAHPADFNIATGLKWAPLRYTRPIGLDIDCTSGGATPNDQIICTHDPHPLYGWQTTSLDNYIAFFFTEQIGFQLSLDFGYTSHGADQAITAVHDVSYFQFGVGLGGKFYLNRSAAMRAAPARATELFSFFSTLNHLTAPPGPTLKCSVTFLDQGTPNEKVTHLMCPQSLAFNAIRILPLNGNTFQAFFGEGGQNCMLDANGNVVCLFTMLVTDSGLIDERYNNPPSTTKPNADIQRSADGGATWFEVGPVD
jgi:hypothetical protein